MAVTLEGLQEYLGLLPDQATGNARLCLEAAIAAATAAGIPQFAHNPQYDLFIYALAGLWYDNRSFTFADPKYGQPQATQNMINYFVWQLRYAQDGAPEGGG